MYTPVDIERVFFVFRSFFCLETKVQLIPAWRSKSMLPRERHSKTHILDIPSYRFTERTQYESSQVDVSIEAGLWRVVHSWHSRLRLIVLGRFQTVRTSPKPSRYSVERPIYQPFGGIMTLYKITRCYCSRSGNVVPWVVLGHTQLLHMSSRSALKGLIPNGYYNYNGGIKARLTSKAIRGVWGLSIEVILI